MTYQRRQLSPGVVLELDVYENGDTRAKVTVAGLVAAKASIPAPWPTDEPAADAAERATILALAKAGRRVDRYAAAVNEWRTFQRGQHEASDE